MVRLVAPPRLGNISTRAAVGTGDQVLIGGFIISGNAPKKVLMRATAPSLKVDATPVPGRLMNPVLELHGAGLFVTNDDWETSQKQEIIDTNLPPQNERESAIVATLDPGAYTAIMRGKNETIGIGLVEIYDLGNPTNGAIDSSLANISGRGSVQLGDEVIIGGFIVTGARTNVIVRAIGPDLANRGVPGAVQDTTLELFDANGLIASNDDWQSDQKQKIVASKLAANDSRESALVASLLPGGYTAIVRGKGGTTGVALVKYSPCLEPIIPLLDQSPTLAQFQFV